jgi:taurine dioxygenase
VVLDRLKRLGIGPRATRAPLGGDPAPPFRRLAPSPLSPGIGAEITGLDLREALDDETFAELRRAFLDWKVLFFRGQDLTAAQHVAFARRFGELEVHPFLPHAPGCPEVVVFAKDEQTRGVENVWHSDVSWRESPALGAVLRAREVPPVGGDTLFADMEAAYEGLPEELKRRLDGLRAVHDFSQTFGLLLPPEERARRQAEFPPVEHPVVRTHPETGRKILYVNAIFTSHVVGLPPAESEELLGLLFQRAWIPEYQCRFRWQKDSIAFWDNRAVQHYAVSDYHPARRVMERVSIVGDRPF